MLSELAASMTIIKDPADFLSPPSRAIFDVELIKTALNKLTPSNSIVFIGSPNFSTPTNLQGLPQPNLDTVEPWFNTSFSKIDTPSDAITAWNIDNKTVRLNLPPENTFIPKTLKVLPLEKNHATMPTQVKSDNGKILTV